MFIASLLIVAMAPSPSAAVDTTRVAFTKCLNTHMKKSLEAKMPTGEYEIAVKAACDTERAAFRSAVITLDRSSGDSEADAAENADMQIDDYNSNFTDKFKDYTESKTMPGS
jgi:hypothetical protein